VTDLAARYLSTLCEKTADHAVHNHGDAGDFSTVDIRMALQDLGALLPEALPVQQEWLGEEDLRGVEEFVKWFSGQRMKEIMDFAKGDGENDEIDYLHGESGRGLLAFQLALSPLAWLTYDDSTEKET
jgi:transcription initiation factor TFIID subunit 3